jgi:hypothetical protein
VSDPWDPYAADAGHVPDTLSAGAVGCVDGLVARFEEVRRGEQLDESAAELLRRAYIEEVAEPQHASTGSA